MFGGASIFLLGHPKMEINLDLQRLSVYCISFLTPFGPGLLTCKFVRASINYNWSILKGKRWPYFHTMVKVVTRFAMA